MNRMKMLEALANEAMARITLPKDVDGILREMAVCHARYINRGVHHLPTPSVSDDIAVFMRQYRTPTTT